MSYVVLDEVTMALEPSSVAPETSAYETCAREASAPSLPIVIECPFYK